MEKVKEQYLRVKSELQELSETLDAVLSTDDIEISDSKVSSPVRPKMAYVTDDEHNFLKKFRIIFKKMYLPYNLETFTTAEDTIKNYEKGKYEFAFVDVNLKSSLMDGIQLVNEVKNVLGNDCVVTVISSSDGSVPYTGSDINFKGLTQIEAAKKAGAEAWITKGGVELIQRVSNFIEEKVIKKESGFKHYN